MKEENEINNNLNVKRKNKKLIIVFIILLLIIVSILGITLYIVNNSNKKGNNEIGKDIYNNLISIHNKNIVICNTVYKGWGYSKSKRGSFSNTLYQQLEREYNIPFEFTLNYYNLTDEYNSKDTYGKIKILDDIDNKLENDMVFVILKYYENDINETELLLNKVRENLKQLNNDSRFYDIFTDLYSGEIKLNNFTKDPKGTLIELNNLINEITKKYDTDITKLEIEYGS